MSLTINAKTYTYDTTVSPTMFAYVGPLKTLTVKDDVRLGRTAPKPTTTFSGVGRTVFKMTRTLTLTGASTPTGDIIVEVNVTAPVGFASADVDSALNDAGSMVSSASMKAHVKSQQISF